MLPLFKDNIVIFFCQDFSYPGIYIFRKILYNSRNG